MGTFPFISSRAYNKVPREVRVSGLPSSSIRTLAALGTRISASAIAAAFLTLAEEGLGDGVGCLTLGRRFANLLTNLTPSGRPI
jgi:hypothetical protein